MHPESDAWFGDCLDRRNLRGCFAGWAREGGQECCDAPVDPAAGSEAGGFSLVLGFFRSLFVVEGAKRRGVLEPDECVIPLAHHRRDIVSCLLIRVIDDADRAMTGSCREPRTCPVRAEVERISHKLGHRMKFLVGKPGLDGHSNGAEQIAVRARDVGMDVIYAGIRFTPAELVRTAKEEGVDVIGLSILSGSHVPLVRDVVDRMRAEGLEDIPVVVGGIVPPEDEVTLKQAGVAAVYTPKDFQINQIMSDVVRIVEQADRKVVA